MSKDAADKANNIIVGPDYGQLMKNQTNGAILEAFIGVLFSKQTKFTKGTVAKMIRNLVILMTIKTILEESKSYLDKFKFTDLSFIQYLTQRLRYSEARYDFYLVGGKWTYNGKNMSTNTLVPFFEQKGVFFSQPGTYYYRSAFYLFKVVVNSNKISVCIPNIELVIKTFENDVITRHMEYVYGDRTTMSRVIITGTSMIKLEPIKLSYAFPTANYIQLENSLKMNFCLSNILALPSGPLCINFNGEPGTGKTTFGSYIARAGLFDRVIVYNLLQSTKTDFNDIITTLDRNISHTSVSKDKKEEQEVILLILDEIDKWLDSYLNNKIDTLQEEARNKQEKSENNKTVAVSREKLSSEEEKSKRVNLRDRFFDQLMLLMDGLMMQEVRKYVIIFNTNHFDKMFENCDKKYIALKDRFQKYNFQQSTKKDIIYYFDNINSKLQEYLDTNRDDEDKQKYRTTCANLISYDKKIYDELPDDIKISYRSLLKILKDKSFNIPEVVLSLKESTEIREIQQDNQTNQTIQTNQPSTNTITNIPNSEITDV